MRTDALALTLALALSVTDAVTPMKVDLAASPCTAAPLPCSAAAVASGCGVFLMRASCESASIVSLASRAVSLCPPGTHCKLKAPLLHAPDALL
jgi:hypothetical protein